MNALWSTVRSTRSMSRSGAIAVAVFTAAVLSATAAAAAAVVITVSPSDNYVVAIGPSSRGEIAGNYGAPTGLGQTAAELDTVAVDNPDETNWAGIWLHSGTDNPALPAYLALADLDELSVWAYRDSSSIDKRLPVFRLEILTNGVAYPMLELHAEDNPDLTIPDDTWTPLDLTLNGEAQWRIPGGYSDTLFPGQNKELATLAEIAAASDAVYGPKQTRIYAVLITQGDYPAPVYDSLFTAIDGFRIAAGEQDLTFDFEARALSKDDCKNGGWSTPTSGGPWKNQGECIAAFLTAD